MMDNLDGLAVYDPKGAKVGVAGAVRGGGPGWLRVRTGLPHHESLVPLSAVRVERDRVEVGYYRELVTDAPRMSTDDDRPLSGDELGQLLVHYRLDPDGRPAAGPAPWRRTGAYTTDAPPASD